MVLLIPSAPRGAELLLAYHLGKEGFPFDFSHHQIPYSASPKADPATLPAAGAPYPGRERNRSGDPQGPL